MKYTGVIGVSATLLLFVSAFMPWIYIGSIDTVVTGINPGNTGFGILAFLNFFFSAIALVLFIVPKIWAKRYNFLFTGANMAWSLRNLLLLNICHAGECPVLKPGLYIMMSASVIMFIASLFPGIKLPADQAGNRE